MDILNTVRIEYKYNTVTITVELHFEIHLYHCVDRGLGLIDGLGAIRRHDRPFFLLFTTLLFNISNHVTNWICYK